MSLRPPLSGSKRTLHSRLASVDVGDRYPVCIIGAINLTKNSFYTGSVRRRKVEILSAAISMGARGASIIDIGARSTAPYRDYDIATEVEARLVSRAVRLLRGRIETPISVDTVRLEVAKKAVEEGATIINDVYGFLEPDGRRIANLVASRECSVILSAHEKSRGIYHDAIRRISACLIESLKTANANGIESKKMVIDPAIGFFSDSKLSNEAWNSTVLCRLRALRVFGLPICVGLSRKRFIGRLLDDRPPEGRLLGSLAATAIAVFNGCHVIRTHDVGETVEVAKIAQAIRKQGLALAK